MPAASKAPAHWNPFGLAGGRTPDDRRGKSEEIDGDVLGTASYGAFTNGEQIVCTGSPPQCEGVLWPYTFSAYDREHGISGRNNWQGSLLESGQDKSGLQFRRNRYYDPQTGRFTQEDPIGLAGGLNLYGFAGGDPVTFSDPFGLGPCKGLAPWAWIKCFAAYEWRGFQAGSDLTRLDVDFEEEGQLGALVGRLTAGRVGAGRVVIGGGASRAVPILTRWGWTGGLKYRNATRQLGTESRQPVTHMNVGGIVPTQGEAIQLIENAGGVVKRIEQAHPVGGASSHTFPHINYTTRGGTKATVRITEVEP